MNSNPANIVDPLYESVVERLPSNLQFFVNQSDRVQTQIKNLLTGLLKQESKPLRGADTKTIMAGLLPQYLKSINNITVHRLDDKRSVFLHDIEALESLILCYMHQFCEPKIIGSIIQTKSFHLNPPVTFKMAIHSLKTHQQQIKKIIRESKAHPVLIKLYKQHSAKLNELIVTYKKECKPFMEIPFFQLSKKYVLSTRHLDTEKIERESSSPKLDPLYIGIMKALNAYKLTTIKAAPAIERTTPLQIVNTINNLIGKAKLVALDILDLELLHHISQAKQTSTICFYGGGMHCETLTTELQKLGYEVKYDSKIHDRNKREYKNYAQYTEALSEITLSSIRENVAPLPLKEFKWLSK